MPRTVDEGFQDFLQKLTPSNYESDAAKLHRASIKQCLVSNFGLHRFWRIGSFGNGTSISGYSDVDYMASIPTEKLKKNSSISLTAVRNALASRFPNTRVRTSCPAVVVPFGTDAKESTEITPADYLRAKKDFEIYDIPDCTDGWMEASPDVHNAYVRLIDKRLSFKVKPLIRFIKAWKYFQNVPISSFYLELRVTKYASNESFISYASDIQRVFAHLEDIDLAWISDPMGISGYISPCKSKVYLESAKSKVSTALSRATKACKAKERDNIKDAFAWWNMLFGCKFPSHYR